MTIHITRAKHRRATVSLGPNVGIGTAGRSVVAVRLRRQAPDGRLRNYTNRSDVALRAERGAADRTGRPEGDGRPEADVRPAVKAAAPPRPKLGPRVTITRHDRVLLYKCLDILTGAARELSEPELRRVAALRARLSIVKPGATLEMSSSC